ncbi:P protein-like [Stomoxys calcitrans]|uniref:P protein-like n=1 Tax=Stomoxys calcitrans TaxID=35570 RepID=UPI0027E28FDC|nr:P protein-like [Stomoxys calcitrans]
MEDITDEFNSLENFNYPEEFLEMLCPSHSRHQMRCSGGSEAPTSDDHLSVNEEPEEEPYRAQPPSSLHLHIRKFIPYLRQGLLFICWLTFCYALMLYEEHENEPGLVSVPSEQGYTYKINGDLQRAGLVVQLRGPFSKETFQEIQGPAETSHKPYLGFVLQELSKDKGHMRNMSHIHHLVLTKEANIGDFSMMPIEHFIGNLFMNHAINDYQLLFFTNLNETLAMEFSANTTNLAKKTPLIWILLLFALIYINIMLDLLHRTFAALICSSLGIALIAAVHLRPRLDAVFQNIDYEVIMAFFGISLIMEMLAETGLQDYLAALSYEMANGHIWPLLNFLFLISCTMAAVFDGLTLMLFLAPICLRLCEIMHLNCTPVLSCLMVAINVGSVLTPSSSVTNYLIANHKDLPQHQITFGNFLAHMFPVTLLTLAQSYIHLRLLFGNSAQIGTKEPLQLERLKRLTRVWRKVSDRMGGYSLDERAAKATVDTRVRNLRKRLKRLGRMPEPVQGFEENVQKLRKSFPLRKIPLMVACLVALAFFLLFPLLQMMTSAVLMPIGWIAILGALLSLSLCNYGDIEGVLSRIDWATMLFLACVSILMNVLVKLGFLEFIGLGVEQLLLKTQAKHHLTWAILLTLGITAGLSLLINNVPVASLMIPVLVTLARNESLNLSLMPLVWSLALGCCLGGNGSLLAAVVNAACAGVASKHGYGISYFGFLKIGFFVMLGNIAVASCYLLLAHVVGHWH